MNPKLKQELLDLAHLLHQAIITDDDRVAEDALADMADALASILPVDHSARDTSRGRQADAAEGRARALPSLVGRGLRSAPISATQDYKRFLTVAPGVTLVRFAGKETITLMAKRPANNLGLAPAIFKVFVDKVRKIGCVCCDDKTLFQIVGRECQSASQLERVCIGALHRILHDRRNRTLRSYRQRKAKRNSATQVNG